MFKQYRRTGLSEMRPFVPGEDLAGVSVSDTDTPELGGMIARNPKNHDDQWYVAKKYFDDNLELVDGAGDSSYQDRVVEEMRELNEKIDSLDTFIHSKVFPSVDVIQQNCLKRQIDAMELYSKILGERISAF